MAGGDLELYQRDHDVSHVAAGGNDSEEAMISDTHFVIGGCQFRHDELNLGFLALLLHIVASGSRPPQP